MYLSLGMKLTQIHKILKFKQMVGWKNILTLTLNEEKMQRKNWRKLLQTNEQQYIWQNSRKLKKEDVRLVNNEKGYLKYVSKSTFTSKKFFL